MTEHLPTFSREVKFKWFVKKDECDDEFIRLNGKKALLNGGLDHIYLISPDRLGVWLTRRNTKRILGKVPGSQIEQAGGDETVICCGIEHLELLCDAVGAKRRQRLTDEQRAERSRQASVRFAKTHRELALNRA